ncbi:MAG: hypothetical protein HQK92_15300 [Nitrospirae bacterium]|nr:hypothetical protein [Nitrospirota bacterium]
MLETIEKPEYVLRGNKGTLKAVRNVGNRKWLVVIYREMQTSDGFIITAYFLNNTPKGELLWTQK